MSNLLFDTYPLIICIYSNICVLYYSYKIRSNPFYDSSPSPSKLYGSSHQCRKVSANKLTKKILHRHHHNNDQNNEEISCPAIHYIYSGFMALQILVDITKISLVSNISMTLPNYRFVLFPKPAYTASEF